MFVTQAQVKNKSSNVLHSNVPKINPGFPTEICRFFLGSSQLIWAAKYGGIGFWLIASTQNTTSKIVALKKSLYSFVSKLKIKQFIYNCKWRGFALVTNILYSKQLDRIL